MRDRPHFSTWLLFVPELTRCAFLCRRRAGQLADSSSICAASLWRATASSVRAEPWKEILKECHNCGSSAHLVADCTEQWTPAPKHQSGYQGSVGEGRERVRARMGMSERAEGSSEMHSAHLYMLTTLAIPTPNGLSRGLRRTHTHTPRWCPSESRPRWILYFISAFFGGGCGGAATSPCLCLNCCSTSALVLGGGCRGATTSPRLPAPAGLSRGLLRSWTDAHLHDAVYRPGIMKMRSVLLALRGGGDMLSYLHPSVESPPVTERVMLDTISWPPGVPFLKLLDALVLENFGTEFPLRDGAPSSFFSAGWFRGVVRFLVRLSASNPAFAVFNSVFEESSPIPSTSEVASHFRNSPCSTSALAARPDAEIPIQAQSNQDAMLLRVPLHPLYPTSMDPLNSPSINAMQPFVAKINPKRVPIDTEDDRVHTLISTVCHSRTDNTTSGTRLRESLRTPLSDASLRFTPAGPFAFQSVLEPDLGSRLTIPVLVLAADRTEVLVPGLTWFCVGANPPYASVRLPPFASELVSRVPSLLLNLRRDTVDLRRRDGVDLRWGDARRWLTRFQFKYLDSARGY
ncbi:hypothetical protein B0H17DRAFT_1127221 [Mycena rosella]|uniref:CCHC-type domain-containing protein n=1 Tax=Mycena rosella TaxID=1033263 RepID=A0AAD7DZW2_MYCRO|nr:hypothetical protein B0H17DRAFT_1127221 [Mycena rosella]